MPMPMPVQGLDVTGFACATNHRCTALDQQPNETETWFAVNKSAVCCASPQVEPPVSVPSTPWDLTCIENKAQATSNSHRQLVNHMHKNVSLQNYVFPRFFVVFPICLLLFVGVSLLLWCFGFTESLIVVVLLEDQHHSTTPQSKLRTNLKRFQIFFSIFLVFRFFL